MKKQVKKKNVTLEDLAGMVAKGFNSVDKTLIATREDIHNLDKRIAVLEGGQEQIRLRLDNVAYRFEMVDLKNRVERLENKAGIKYR